MQYTTYKVYVFAVLQLCELLVAYLYNSVGFGASIQWVTRQNLPVIKHTLWECLPARIAAQICRET
jgi:hypothetical protein